MIDADDAEAGHWPLKLQRDGYAIRRSAIAPQLVEQLKFLCAAAGNGPQASRRGDTVYGIRCLLENTPAIRSIVSQPPFSVWATEILGAAARPVSGIFFDKTPDANWPVPWHQDVTIRVQEGLPVEGFEPRPVKDGMVHLLPPQGVSEQILAMRIHLDGASSSHGALRVIPGTHRIGRLDHDRLQAICDQRDPVICEVNPGDVMLMRPLLIHASSPCTQPTHRRVIHLEYAAIELPGGLRWQG